MSKCIIIEGTTRQIPVIDIYPFTYDYGNGKTVLRISIGSDVLTFEELRDIFTKATPIHSYESTYMGCDLDGKPITKTEKTVYENYCNDYMCKYNSEKDIFEIEITKKSDTELAIEANQNQTIDAYAAVAEVYEMI